MKAIGRERVDIADILRVSLTSIVLKVEGANLDGDDQYP
jgi:hypothetical protein